MKERTVGRYRILLNGYNIPILKIQNYVLQDLEFEFGEYYRFIVYKILNNDARFIT